MAKAKKLPMWTKLRVLLNLAAQCASVDAHGGDGMATTLKFHYIKSPLARDLHIDGIFGGINPVSGQTNLSVFAERAAIPTSITAELSDAGTVGQEVAREGKDGIVRVVQDTLYLDFSSVYAISRWLNKQIETFLDAHPEIKSQLPKD